MKGSEEEGNRVCGRKDGEGGKSRERYGSTRKQEDLKFHTIPTKYLMIRKNAQVQILLVNKLLIKTNNY